MFFFEKKTISSPLSKTSLLIKGLALLLLFSSAANAQRVGIYNQTTDEVAGVTALMSAVVSHDVQGVAFFSKSGKALINQKNYGGATALHLAARLNKIEIAKILIANGARIDAVDNEKWTPLMRATLAGNVDMMKLLLQNGAQGDARNSVKETIISQAIIANCNECLSTILGEFDFPKYVKIPTLTTWLNKAYGSAHNKGDEGAKKIISDYLDVILANDQAARDKFLNDFQEQTLQAPTPRAINGKMFKFTPKKEEVSQPIIEEILEIKDKKEEVAIPNKGSEIVPAPIKFFKFKSVKPLKMPEKEVEEKAIIQTPDKAKKKETKKFSFSKGAFFASPVNNVEKTPIDTESEKTSNSDLVEEEFNQIEESRKTPKKRFRFKWWGSQKDAKNDIIPEEENVLGEETLIEENKILDNKKPRKFKFNKGGEYL